jgi:hypothetical protein
MISNSTTITGLTVHCVLDTDHYPTGTTDTAKVVDALQITRADFHGECNYTRPSDHARIPPSWLASRHPVARAALGPQQLRPIGIAAVDQQLIQPLTNVVWFS